MGIADTRRAWHLRSGRHIYDASRPWNDDGEHDGWIATFADVRDAEFVASLITDTAAERDAAARTAAHDALWNARRAMYLAGICQGTTAHEILTDAIAALEPSPTS